MKIFSLYSLVVIAVVSADVVHLQSVANGYNYPHPYPTFEDSLVSSSKYQPNSQIQQQSANYRPQFQYQHESQSFYQPQQQQQEYAYDYFPGYQYFPPASQNLPHQLCPQGTIGEYPYCELPPPDAGFISSVQGGPEKQGTFELDPNVLKSLLG